MSQLAALYGVIGDICGMLEFYDGCDEPVAGSDNRIVRINAKDFEFICKNAYALGPIVDLGIMKGEFKFDSEGEAEIAALKKRMDEAIATHPRGIMGVLEDHTKRGEGC